MKNYTIKKVENLTNTKGNKVANQFVITHKNDFFDDLLAYTFQSYESKVAVFDSMLTLGCDFDFSVTTARHLATFLHDYCNITANTKALRTAIQKGFIVNNSGQSIKVVYDSELR